MPDTTKFRYPEQQITPGRGEAGYTGNVEIIPSGKQRSPGPKAPLTSGGSGLDARQALATRAKELGVPVKGSNAELEAAIAEAEGKA